MPNQQQHVGAQKSQETASLKYSFSQSATYTPKAAKKTVLSQSLQVDLAKTLFITLFLLAAEIVLFFLLKQRVLHVPLISY